MSLLDLSLLESLLLVTTFAGLLVGALSIHWARSRQSLANWGRRLFIATLLLLGGTGLVAAGARADGLVPLGLVAGFLVIGMLWDNPAPQSNRL